MPTALRCTWCRRKRSGWPATTWGRVRGKEGLGSALLVGVAVVFVVWVMFRSAFLHKRYRDLAVFLRAAGGVSHGLDLYAIPDDRGLFYHSPPLLAILLIPLADPPG